MSTPPPLPTLRDRLFALDPTLDFDAFLLAMAAEILAATGARAVGVGRRFVGASRDYALLVTPGLKSQRRIRSLVSEGRFEALPISREGKILNAFHNKFLAEMAKEIELSPEQVFLIPVSYRGKPVLDLEVADPDPTRITLAALESHLAETGVLFELAVVQARLRRERHESRHLLQVGKELGRTRNLGELLNSVLDLLRRVVPFNAAAIYVLGEDGLSAVHHSIRGYDKGQESIVELKLDQGIVGGVARSGKGEIVSDVFADPRYLNARPQTKSEMVVPLKSGGRVIGVFNLESDRPAAYTPHEMELLETFAGHAAAAIERGRLLQQEKAQQRLEQEISIAREIQKSFLPQPDPERGRLGIAGKSLFSVEMSGDYYDFVHRRDGRLAVALADVSGKGIPAALIMASIRAAFRYEAVDSEGTDLLCRNLNMFLVHGLRETEFVTGVFGFLDLETMRLAYTNAGHNPPLLLRSDGSHEWLEAGGMILGAFSGMEYETGTVDLQPGDRLVLYTDGVTEAHSGDHEDYGNERLIQTVREHGKESSEAICNAIIQSVRRYVRGDLPDDLTLVVVSGDGAA